MNQFTVKRHFVYPWLISINKEKSIFGGDAYDGLYGVKIYNCNGAGTMKTYSRVFQFIFNGKMIFELRLCWRPDVTHYWLIRDPSYMIQKDKLCQRKKENTLTQKALI